MRFRVSVNDSVDLLITANSEMDAVRQAKYIKDSISRRMLSDKEEWITVRGSHIKVGEGESKTEAVKNFIESKRSLQASSSGQGGSKSSYSPSSWEGRINEMDEDDFAEWIDARELELDRSYRAGDKDAFEEGKKEIKEALKIRKNGGHSGDKSKIEERRSSRPWDPRYKIDW